MSNLIQSHRLLGYEAGRVTVDGEDLVLVRTGVHRIEVAPPAQIRPASAVVVRFGLHTRLVDAIIDARFLGLSDDEIRAAMDAALQRSES